MFTICIKKDIIISHTTIYKGTPTSRELLGLMIAQMKNSHQAQLTLCLCYFNIDLYELCH